MEHDGFFPAIGSARRVQAACPRDEVRGMWRELRMRLRMWWLIRPREVLLCGWLISTMLVHRTDYMGKLPLSRNLRVFNPRGLVAPSRTLICFTTACDQHSQHARQHRKYSPSHESPFHVRRAGGSGRFNCNKERQGPLRPCVHPDPYSKREDKQ